MLWFNISRGLSIKHIFESKRPEFKIQVCYLLCSFGYVISLVWNLGSNTVKYCDFNLHC